MPSIPQEKLKSWLWRFASVFFFLYVFTLTFDYYLIEFWFDVVTVPFKWLAEQTGMLFFGVNLLGADKFYSDSLLVCVHVFNLAMIAMITASVWTILSPSPDSYRDPLSLTKFHPITLTLLRYFVALNLFVYGFSKLYKWQFMLPEPNILYTRVGEMHRDILYWTSMGTSRSYSMFMGLIEIVPAILLLFRRTTLIGAFITVLVMTNVVAVNFGFDITVKLHSMMLLIMSLVILIPGRKRIVALFTGKATEEWKYPAMVIAPSKKWISPVLKVAAIALLLAESHYPYTETGTFNDDVSERPPMCGAYDVQIVNSAFPDTTISTAHNLPSRIFIHRRGYVIFEYYSGEMVDYPMSIDTTSKTIRYDDMKFTWREINGDTLEFLGVFDHMYGRLNVVRLHTEELPLMENEFTLIDED